MVGTEALTFPQTPSPSKSPSARPSAFRSPGDCGQQRRGVRTLASALAFEDGGVAQDGREAGVREGGREGGGRWRPPFLPRRQKRERTDARAGRGGRGQGTFLGLGVERRTGLRRPQLNGDVKDDQRGRHVFEDLRFKSCPLSLSIWICAISSHDGDPH